MRGENQPKKLNKGLTLIEVLIASSIFGMIIGGVTLFGVRTIQSHMKSRAMEHALDNARFAIEDLNKEIRTSHLVTTRGLAGGAASQNYSSNGSTDIVVIDNKDEVAYCYEFIDGILTVKKDLDDSKDTNGSGAIDCNDFNAADGQVILIGGGNNVTVNGKFFVKETDPASQRGMVTTVVEIRYNSGSSDPNQTEKIRLQSTVSIRDYQL